MQPRLQLHSNTPATSVLCLSMAISTLFNLLMNDEPFIVMFIAVIHLTGHVSSYLDVHYISFKQSFLHQPLNYKPKMPLVMIPRN